MAQTPPTVPRSELPEGIERCLAKTERLCRDARTLLAADAVVHASILFSYAVEELGKAALIADGLRGSTDDPLKLVWFYNHRAKLERAEKLIGEPGVTLWPGAFQRNAFGRGFQIGHHASDLQDRLEMLYVDWQPLVNGGRWKPELTALPEYLRRGIDGLLQTVVKCRADWL